MDDLWIYDCTQSFVSKKQSAVRYSTPLSVRTTADPDLIVVQGPVLEIDSDSDPELETLDV